MRPLGSATTTPAECAIRRGDQRVRPPVRARVNVEGAVKRPAALRRGVREHDADRIVDRHPALATRPVWLDRFFLLFSMGPRRSSETVAGLNCIRPSNGSTESTASGASVQGRLARRLGDRLGPAVSFATTEHFNLQTARVATVSEANGRGSIYLA